MFICGCLSRVAAVPVWPLAAAVAGIPVSAILVWIHGRLFIDRKTLAWLAGALLSGAAVFWLCAADRNRLELVPASAEPTGADDTGAYD